MLLPQGGASLESFGHPGNRHSHDHALQDPRAGPPPCLAGQLFCPLHRPHIPVE